MSLPSEQSAVPVPDQGGPPGRSAGSLRQDLQSRLRDWDVSDV